MFIFYLSHNFQKPLNILVSVKNTRLILALANPTSVPMTEFFFIFNCLSNAFYQHSHKKRKDSLESSLDRILTPDEFDTVSMLFRNISKVNIECVGKPKQLCSLYDQPLKLLMSLLIVLILYCVFN